MLFEFSDAKGHSGDELVYSVKDTRWGVDSEYARLTDVLVASPAYLEVVPCNSVSRESIAAGLDCCPDTAARQHRAFVATLERQGVTCHVVPPEPGLADLCFTRDTTLMTPWGLVALRPSAKHRRTEPAHVREALESLSIPYLGAIEQGSIEGGDVAIVRPGLIVIGVSGERTDAAGADALAAIFEDRGWRALRVPFDPHFLHLDTLFSMVSPNRAVACVEELPDAFLAELGRLGIALVHATVAEVKRLGGNLVSLGAGRVLSPADNGRINGELERLGYMVIPVEVDQFTRCGGGVHCLTMPLGRLPG